MRTTGKFIENSQIAGWVFISPWLCGFIGFIVLPMFASLYLSFTKYDLLSAPQWIGLSNYLRMFTDDPLFLKSLGVTVYYVFLAVPLRLLFALLIAMLLCRKHRFINVYRTIYYIPSLLGGSVAISVTWRMLFGTSSPLHIILRLFGLPRMSFVGMPHTAMLTIILLAVWQFGSSMLIFMAGLKNIPDSYYEAAAVDGAGSWTRFFHITLPMLSPVILFNLIMQTINGFIIFTQVYVVTQGGPMNSTLVYALYMYKRAFSYFDMGFACSMAWFLLGAIALLTGMIFKTSKYWVYYEAK
jgi:multiple sugar transport system permease protein